MQSIPIIISLLMRYFRIILYVKNTFLISYCISSAFRWNQPNEWPPCESDSRWKWQNSYWHRCPKGWTAGYLVRNESWVSSLQNSLLYFPQEKWHATCLFCAFLKKIIIAMFWGGCPQGCEDCSLYVLLEWTLCLESQQASLLSRQASTSVYQTLDFQKRLDQFRDE